MEIKICSNDNVLIVSKSNLSNIKRYFNNSLDEFSLIIKGLLSVIASEAVCERGLQKLINISNSKCPKILKELIDAILTLMSYKK